MRYSNTLIKSFIISLFSAKINYFLKYKMHFELLNSIHSVLIYNL